MSRKKRNLTDQERATLQAADKAVWDLRTALDEAEASRVALLRELLELNVSPTDIGMSLYSDEAEDGRVNRTVVHRTARVLPRPARVYRRPGPPYGGATTER